MQRLALADDYLQRRHRSNAA